MRPTYSAALLAFAVTTSSARAQDNRADNDDVQFEFAPGTPAPSFVRRQGSSSTTATRVP